MIKVNSKVNIYSHKIKNLNSAAITALEKTAEALHTRVGQTEVVPMKDGTLSGEGFFCDYSESDNGSVSLVHSTPYARRLYYHPEYNFSTEFHANARGEWFEPWLPGGEEEDFAKKAFSQFYKKESGV